MYQYGVNLQCVSVEAKTALIPKGEIYHEGKQYSVIFSQLKQKKNGS